MPITRRLFTDLLLTREQAGDKPCPMNRVPLAAAVLTILMLTAYAWSRESGVHAWSVVIGAAAGVVLYNATVSFYKETLLRN